MKESILVNVASTLRKVVERLVRTRACQYLEWHSVLRLAQCGFMSDRLYLTSLLFILLEGKQVEVCRHALSKAIASANYHLRLTKREPLLYPPAGLTTAGIPLMA